MDEPNTITWITFYNFQNDSIFTKYFTSLYIAFTTMTTIGYGDFTPKNELERIINIIVMLVACGTYAYVFNQIGTLLNNIQERSKEHREVLLLINSYMKNQNVPDILQKKARGNGS
ncbi:hypothetical protein PPERSA_07413 [Pseudocohnilembus persalinus]|uniref:Potassium channel domain-containing protein n=1 Tax=Pseudocohnilembus persalinus TaxID=266149 RepID=A0A0V0QAF2_PSEPJ|nr:hypothetical protein PPERSA_07413 [Pseudocohnilembus persalinus]|eukprot:KRW99170.1 hypothetical protein PPERSA_07413 [Pseudocohnilembus persalinus]